MNDLIPTYHPSMIAPIIPKKNQFCIVGVASLKKVLTIWCELRAAIAITIKNSIANQVQYGHDSFGM
jgi:hypothetical protein